MEYTKKIEYQWKKKDNNLCMFKNITKSMTSKHRFKVLESFSKMIVFSKTACKLVSFFFYATMYCHLFTSSLHIWKHQPRISLNFRPLCFGRHFHEVSERLAYFAKKKKKMPFRIQSARPGLQQSLVGINF